MSAAPCLQQTPGWTVAGMAAQFCWRPLKENLVGGRDHNALGEFKKFLPGAYSLDEILEKQGYNQHLLWALKQVLADAINY